MKQQHQRVGEQTVERPAGPANGETARQSMPIETRLRLLERRTRALEKAWIERGWISE